MFDPNGPQFKATVLFCLGIILILVLIALAWEYFYWGPKLKMERGVKKGNITRFLSLHRKHCGNLYFNATLLKLTSNSLEEGSYFLITVLFHGLQLLEIYCSHLQMSYRSGT